MVTHEHYSYDSLCVCASLAFTMNESVVDNGDSLVERCRQGGHTALPT